MRLELQFSFCFLADYLAAKIIALIDGQLAVGTTQSIGTLVNYVPQPSPPIFNRGSGVVGVSLVISPFLPPLQLELSASTSQGLNVTSTLVNRDAIIGALSSLSSSIDPNLIPSSLHAPIDLSSIIGSGLQDPTKTGFAANGDARVVALRVELGDVATADSGSWTAFLDSHAFTPAFQPGDISVDPPREWAVLVDWEIVKPRFAAELEPLVKSRITALAPDASVTGDFVYAWGLSRGDQHSGFSDAWPFDSNGAFDLDVTCPAHAQGHDGALYFQIGLSATGRNRMHSHVQIKAHVWCCWQDADSVDVDDPFGDFNFDGNLLRVDAISTDARGMVVRGVADLLMPLALPTPSVDVGSFTWILEDACNTRALAQVVSVYLINATGGRTTPLRGRLTVDTLFPYKVESIPILDANGIGTAPLAWVVTVMAQDVPTGGGQATLSVQTNAGAPSFRSGPSVSLNLAPLLTEAQKLQMEIKAVATCERSRHVGYVKKFVPDPPEEIIWWVTQELVVVPPVSRAGAPMAATGPVTRVAVPKSELVAAIREQRKSPHGIMQRHSIGQDGVRVVVRRVEQSVPTKTAGVSNRRGRGAKRV
jgi:hypothetical protein